MDIDLLFTDDGEAGIICNGNLVKKVAGAVIGTDTGVLTLEFVDMDFMEMNIPVEAAFISILDHNTQVHIGAIKNGNIAQAYQIPFMFLDDPYRTEAMMNVRQYTNPLSAFDRFVKNCTAGQPIHRDDLGDEDGMGCVLGDAQPNSLQFAPHLARRHAVEVSPKAAPQHTPRFSGPGLGSGGGGASRSGSSYRKPPGQNRSDNDDN